jgi:hypothetical protein
MYDLNTLTNTLTGTLAISTAILLSNIGARHIVADVEHIALFAHPYMCYVYVCSMAFIGTRNILASLYIAVIYGIIKFLAGPKPEKTQEAKQSGGYPYGNLGAETLPQQSLIRPDVKPWDNI